VLKDPLSKDYISWTTFASCKEWTRVVLGQVGRLLPHAAYFRYVTYIDTSNKPRGQSERQSDIRNVCHNCWECRRQIEGRESVYILSLTRLTSENLFGFCRTPEFTAEIKKYIAEHFAEPFKCNPHSCQIIFNVRLHFTPKPLKLSFPLSTVDNNFCTSVFFPISDRNNRVFYFLNLNWEWYVMKIFDRRFFVGRYSPLYLLPLSLCVTAK
jgi:hypothetical protein